MYRLLTLIFLLGSTVYANTPTFTVGSDPLLNIQSTGTALNLGDDQMSGMKPLGFDFEFYGSTFDDVNISMNGFFTFQNNFSVSRSRNYLSEVIPATSFNYTVYPLWTDLINNGTQNPYIKTFGNTSDTDQYFVIGWYDAREYNNSNKNSFEAILYETTNVIEFRYDKINVSNHDITIGLQGNNEAVTYLRYEDTNSTTYSETDNFSLTTAEVVDESFSNLSSECLVDSDYSELCDVYDLTFDGTEEDDDFYLQGSGVSDVMLLGYNNEEDFYGFNTEEVYTGTSVFSTSDDGGSDTGDFYDDIASIGYMEYDSRDVEEHEDTFDSFDIFDFGDSTLDNSTEGSLTFVDILIPLDELPDVRVTEEEFVEFAQHMDEHFDFEDEMDREEYEEQFEDFEEEIEEREELGETEEEFEEEYEEEFKEEEIGEELTEESGDRPERRTRRRNVVSNTNSIVSNSIANSYGNSNSSSTSSTTASAVSGGSGGTSISSSPSISDQIASAQVQTNNVLQSIEILPVPTMDNTPSMAMAEVQVTSMENQIQSVTSTMVTSSEAEQIAEEIVANNIRAQQQQSQAQQEESGQYDSQGQSNLIAYMNYVPNFSDYTSANITDQTNWYTPTVIYASVTLEDNAGYSFMVSDSMNTLQNMTGGQSTEFFIDRR